MIVEVVDVDVVCFLGEEAILEGEGGGGVLAVGVEVAVVDDEGGVSFLACIGEMAGRFKGDFEESCAMSEGTIVEVDVAEGLPKGDDR